MKYCIEHLNHLSFFFSFFYGYFFNSCLHFIFISDQYLIQRFYICSEEGSTGSSAPGTNSIASSQAIPIYRVPRPPKSSSTFNSPILTLVGNLTRPRRDSWMRINVRHLVQDWFRDPSSNFGLIVGGPTDNNDDVCSVVMRGSSGGGLDDDGRVSQY